MHVCPSQWDLTGRRPCLAPEDCHLGMQEQKRKVQVTEVPAGGSGAPMACSGGKLQQRVAGLIPEHTWDTVGAGGSEHMEVLQLRGQGLLEVGSPAPGASSVAIDSGSREVSSHWGH